MKTLLKILTPTISTLGIATISLASCGTSTTDGLVAIPTQYLNIEGTTLKGLTDEAKQMDLVSKGYKKLTVPKNIKEISINGTASIGYKAITKIDYESDSIWDTIPGYSISGLDELTILIFPPKLSSIGEHAISCSKLSTIDISNVENIDILKDIEWITYPSTTGKIIVAKGKSSIGTAILEKQGLTTSPYNWSVEEK